MRKKETMIIGDITIGNVIATIITENTTSPISINKERSIKDIVRDQTKRKNIENNTLRNTRVNEDNKHDSQKN